MPKTPFVIEVPASLWDDLHLDDVERQRRLLIGYFLGYGPQAIRQLASKHADDRDVLELHRVAPLIGISHLDKITKSKNPSKYNHARQELN